MSNTATVPKTLPEILDDLCFRFIINCPEEELESFEIELAHWFYEDYYRELNPRLPGFNFRDFAKQIFRHCDFLKAYQDQVDEIFESFRDYKSKVPVCGCIILDPSMTYCLMVKGWTSKSGWGFPKGKINRDEMEHICAAREVAEETGYDVTDRINPDEFLEGTIREQKVKLYLITDVGLDTLFLTRTKKEISKIEWHIVDELPSSRNLSKNANSYYTVLPFVNKLRTWIRNKRRSAKKQQKGTTQQQAYEEPHPPLAQPHLEILNEVPPFMPSAHVASASSNDAEHWARSRRAAEHAIKSILSRSQEAAQLAASGLPPPYPQPLPPFPTHQLGYHPPPQPMPPLHLSHHPVMYQQPPPVQHMPLQRSTGGTSVSLDDLFAAAKRSSLTKLMPPSTEENTLSAAPVRRTDAEGKKESKSLSSSASGKPATSPAKINSSGNSLGVSTSTTRPSTTWTNFQFDRAQILRAMQSSH